MKDIKLKDILQEQLHVTDMVKLNKACKGFAIFLINNKLIDKHHEKLTGGDTDTHEFVDDMSASIRNALMRWMDNANNKNHR